MDYCFFFNCFKFTDSKNTQHLQLVLSYDPPNIVDVCEKRFPKIQIILGIIMGVIFLGLVIFFIVDSPKGYEKFRKRKAQVYFKFFVILQFASNQTNSNGSGGIWLNLKIMTRNVWIIWVLRIPVYMKHTVFVYETDCYLESSDKIHQINRRFIITNTLFPLSRHCLVFSSTFSCVTFVLKIGVRWVTVNYVIWIMWYSLKCNCTCYVIVVIMKILITFAHVVSRLLSRLCLRVLPAAMMAI